MIAIKGEWRRIPGYKFDYRINDAARIQKWDGEKWVDIKSRVGGHGDRMVVNLRCKDGTKKIVVVTRLMADAFLGGTKPGQAVIHKNKSFMDCEIENLEIVTLKEASDISRCAARKAVIKYNRNKEILAVYPSAVEAARQEHYGVGAIYRSCNRRLKNPWATRDFNFRWER